VTAADYLNRQRLTLRLLAADVPKAEALLTLAGADTIALRDAADAPVLEPEPDAAPLWPAVTLEALFARDAVLEPLRRMLAREFHDSAPTLDVLEDSAWRAGLEQAVKARAIGTRLWLAPAEDTATPADRAAVRIHMGLAFGTGEHATTASCLEWLERHVASGSTMLDYGCGSGVLALAALALGARYAYAVDNEAQALAATRANAELNRARSRLFVGAPEELPVTAVDVLAANILAGTLVDLAPKLARRVVPGGMIVLAGILESQAERVAAAYAPHFEDFEHAARDGWARLAGRRKAG
jgi:ribosomal protein L11 methyltransferase